MSAGYSKRTLVKKLGIKEDFTIVVVDPPASYWPLLGKLPDDVAVVEPRSRARLDFVHLFVESERDLARRLPTFRRKIVSNGMIWVSWPKKASGVPSDLSGDVVRRLGLESGLVDIKVCAVDETWSGLKFVIPVRDRK